MEQRDQVKSVRNLTGSLGPDFGSLYLSDKRFGNGPQGNGKPLRRGVT